MKRFKDFAKEEGSLDGDKVRIGELFNKEICLTAFRLMKQLKQYESELPFWTIIKKQGSYYTLT